MNLGKRANSDERSCGETGIINYIIPQRTFCLSVRWRSWLSHLSNTQKVLSSSLGRLTFSFILFLPLISTRGRGTILQRAATNFILALVISTALRLKAARRYHLAGPSNPSTFLPSLAHQSRHPSEPSIRRVAAPDSATWM